MESSELRVAGNQKCVPGIFLVEPSKNDFLNESPYQGILHYKFFIGRGMPYPFDEKPPKEPDIISEIIDEDDPDDQEYYLRKQKEAEADYESERDDYFQRMYKYEMDSDDEDNWTWSLITGTYNCSYGAKFNIENLMIFKHDSHPEIVKAFQHEFFGIMSNPELIKAIIPVHTSIIFSQS